MRLSVEEPKVANGNGVLTMSNCSKDGRSFKGLS